MNREKETTAQIAKWTEGVLSMAGQGRKHSRTINFHPRNLVNHPGLLFAPKVLKTLYIGRCYELLEYDMVKFPVCLQRSSLVKEPTTS